VKKFPQMVLTNGLGQALAFVKSKSSKGAYSVIYSQLTDYFRSPHSFLNMPENCELVEWIISLDSATYRHATEETLALFKWLRRFAEGMIQTTNE
jgi:CRISPR-associated protein Cmr5